MKCRRCSTCVLLRHLRLKPNILNLQSLQLDPSTSSENLVRKRKRKNKTRKSKVASQCKKACLVEKEETLNEIVSKLVCVDKFTVSAITKS